MATVPTEYLLIPSPVFKTTKGTFKVDEKSVQSVIQAFEEDGVELPIFFDHPEDETRNKEPAAGYMKLEAREDGIWAVDVKWSETARSQIMDGGWRYHSPEFWHSTKKDKRVLKVLADALVHEPATLHQRPLAAHKLLPEFVAACKTEPIEFNLIAPTEGTNKTTSSRKEQKMADAKHEEALQKLTKEGAEKDAQIEALSKEIETVKKTADDSESFIKSAMEAIECEDRAAFVGAIKAHKDEAAKVPELTEEVEKHRTDAIEAEKAALIESAGLGEDKCKWLEGQPLETVKSYVETCVKEPEVNTGEPQSTEAKKDDDDGKPEDWFVELKKSEGLDNEAIKNEWSDYVKFKKDHPAKKYPEFKMDTESATDAE